MKISSRPWYAAAALAAGTAVAAVALSFAAAPGVAAEGNGKPAGTLTVSPASGTWDDGLNGVPVKTTSTLTCPASSVKRDGKKATPQAVLFIGNPGAESPALDQPIAESGGFGSFTYFKKNFSAFAPNTKLQNPDGSFPDLNESNFPGYANSDDQTWYTTEGKTVYDFADISKPSSTYSLVQACVYLVEDSVQTPQSKKQYFYEPDATGHLRAAWSTLTTDSANNWTVKPVEVPTSEPTSDKPTSDKPTSDKPTSDKPTSDPAVTDPPVLLPNDATVSASTSTSAVAAAGANDPFNPLTNWVSSTASSPAGLGMLFMFLVLLSVPLLLGWRLLLRRNQRRH